MVLDSVAFHFRADFEDMAVRTRALAQLAQALMRLAEAHDAAARPRWDQPPVTDPRKDIHCWVILNACFTIGRCITAHPQEHL